MSWDGVWYNDAVDIVVQIHQFPQSLCLTVQNGCTSMFHRIEFPNNSPNQIGDFTLTCDGTSTGFRLENTMTIEFTNAKGVKKYELTRVTE